MVSSVLVVPSSESTTTAQADLTSGFGMGPGVSPPLWPLTKKIVKKKKIKS